KALGAKVETADGHQPRQVGRQIVIDRRARLRIAGRCQEPAWLVIAKEARGLSRRKRLAIDQDSRFVTNRQRPAGDALALDDDAPGGDPAFGLAARAQPSPR